MSAAEPCPSEGELLEYVDGLLAEARARAISHHLERCAECRAVLASVARASVAQASAAPDAPDAPAPAETPRDLLRQTLERDAPAREMSAMRGVAAVTLACAALTGVIAIHRGASPTVPALLLAMSAIAFGIQRALRRGWYHPAILYVDPALEVSMFVPLLLVIGASEGPLGALSAPTWIPWGCVVVYSAMRAKPLASLAVGLLAAGEAAAVQLALGPAPTPGDVVGLGPVGVVLRCTFMFLAAVMGSWISRQLVRQTDRALATVREQDLMSKYVLHERLGAGGMAEVFRATYCPEGGFRKTVAVKRVAAALASDAQFIEALREEARLCALLAHPNIVQVLDCGRFRDTFIVALELVDGVSLDQLLRRGRLPPAAVVYLASELATALDYIHTRRDGDGEPLGLVHRDLNPPNVLLSRIGEVKLSDFGVAAATTRTVIRNEEGTFYGKSAYASPEQLSGARVDARSDMFALGATLRESLDPAGADPATLALLRLITDLTGADPADRPSAAAVRARLADLGLHDLGSRELVRALHDAHPRAEPPPKSQVATVRSP